MPTLPSSCALTKRILGFAVAPMLACSEPTAFVGGLTGASSESVGPSDSSSSGGATTGTTSDSTADGGPADSSLADSSSSDPSGPKLDVGAAEDSGVASDCAPGTDLIYVLFEVLQLGLPGEVYRLDPAAGTLEFVASIDCSPKLQRYYGLSVDRAGSVYTFSHDEANHFNRINAGGEIGGCESIVVSEAPPSFLYPGQPFEHVFVAIDPEVPQDEELIVHDWVGAPPGRHGRLTMTDTDASIEELAETSYLVAHSAGTGDGRLFSLILDDPQSQDEAPRLVELDPSDGSIETEITTWPGALYLAFYAGDLIVFESRGPGLVAGMQYDLDDDDGNGEHEILEILGPGQFPDDRDMMGAASPTCIPTTPQG